MLIHVKYICRLSLILLAGCGLHTSSWACGVSYYGEEYRVALLNPYVIGQEYAAFFYSSNYLYHYKAYHKGIDRRRNCEEWAAYFNGKVDPAEVEAIVYTTNYDALLNAMEGGASPLSVNRFLKILQLPEQEPVLDYLLLAKKYERISSGRAAARSFEGIEKPGISGIVQRKRPIPEAKICLPIPGHEPVRLRLARISGNVQYLF